MKRFLFVAGVFLSGALAVPYTSAPPKSHLEELISSSYLVSPAAPSPYCASKEQTLTALAWPANPKASFAVVAAFSLESPLTLPQTLKAFEKGAVLRSVVADWTNDEDQAGFMTVEDGDLTVFAGPADDGGVQVCIVAYSDF